MDFYLLILAFFGIALLYSSVGFGGGSSYLALLTLAFTSFYMIRSTALLCNLVVVTGSCILLYRKGHMDFKKFIPFVLASIPLAFIGASFRLKEHIFFIILGAALISSSLILLFQTLKNQKIKLEKKYAPVTSYILGGTIGFLSGLVGIGGGIFLAPVLNHLRWETPIKIAALASFFILVNSVSGIGGLLFSGTFEIDWSQAVALIIAVLVGGQIGIRISISRLGARGIKVATALLVLFVGIRVLLINGLALNL